MSTVISKEVMESEFLYAHIDELAVYTSEGVDCRTMPSTKKLFDTYVEEFVKPRFQGPTSQLLAQAILTIRFHAAKVYSENQLELNSWGHRALHISAMSGGGKTNATCTIALEHCQRHPVLYIVPNEPMIQITRMVILNMSNKVIVPSSIKLMTAKELLRSPPLFLGAGTVIVDELFPEQRRTVLNLIRDKYMTNQAIRFIVVNSIPTLPRN